MTQQNRHLRTIAQFCQAISQQLRHVSTIGKKNLLNGNISSTCPHTMVNFGPLAAEIGSLVWGTPANFNGFHILAALLHGTLVLGINQTLRRGTEGATYIRQDGHTFQLTMLHTAVIKNGPRHFRTWGGIVWHQGQDSSVLRCELSLGHIGTMRMCRDSLDPPNQSRSVQGPKSLGSELTIIQVNSKFLASEIIMPHKNRNNMKHEC